LITVSSLPPELADPPRSEGLDNWRKAQKIIGFPDLCHFFDSFARYSASESRTEKSTTYLTAVQPGRKGRLRWTSVARISSWS
jgi:hypothetical protein